MFECVTSAHINIGNILWRENGTPILRVMLSGYSWIQLYRGFLSVHEKFLKFQSTSFWRNSPYTKTYPPLFLGEEPIWSCVRAGAFMLPTNITPPENSDLESPPKKSPQLRTPAGETSLPSSNRSIDRLKNLNPSKPPWLGVVLYPD